MQVVLLGHSHGATHVTAVASRLEAGGFADRITLNILIDRVTDLYSGDTASLPQRSPVMNYYLPVTEQYHGAPIEQANFENVDVSGEVAPEKGEQGGKIVTVIHSTIDNSPSLLNKIEARIAQALNIAAPTPYPAP
jgi:thioesterase domain-containing protein